MQKRSKIQRVRLRVVRRRKRAQEIAATDDLVHRANAEPSHDLAHFLRNKEEVVHDVLGLTIELCAQLRVLRCDSDRTRVQMTLAHQQATFDDERRCSKSK